GSSDVCSSDLDRVQEGLGEEALALARLKFEGLTRSILIRLAADGLCTPDALATVNPKRLDRRMPNALARKLIGWAKSVMTTQATSEEDHEMPILVVDDRHPGQIELDGVIVPLQEKQFRLIQLLALTPGECVDYETIYAHLWGD